MLKIPKYRNTAIPLLWRQQPVNIDSLKETDMVETKPVLRDSVVRY